MAATHFQELASATKIRKNILIYLITINYPRLQSGGGQAKPGIVDFCSRRRQLNTYTRAKTRSETVWPIDNDEVAAGDGALQILIAFLFSIIEKSSNKPPS
ncbi:hypothetical protein DYBT9623_05009 [Dyadobacter sp. CECT 9623]|uniref:Uncharacterized protein n=1 Tax=Dyadobacter linearis TaxID=2823330 RepID=A0ABN7RDW7_9BACT|nr:hypothetical protein DYBT9623_05009 [Dyadobacter sp. CECT 9623]